MNQILTDAEITLIIRECARGSAINRDGSTSHRIARAIEQAILNKLSEQEPVSQVTCQIYGHVVGACDACNTHAENDVNETNKILADNYLKLTCGSSPSVLDVESKATEIEKYKALCDQMGNALKTLWLAAPTDVECNNMSHPKPKQHRYDETCQLVGEYHEAITGAGKALEAWRAMK